MTARSANTDVLEALAQLELKLTALITAGLAQIKDEHARALLEQAKLNATFANRDALETLRSQLDRNTTQILTLAQRGDVSDQTQKELRLSIDGLNDLISRRTISTYDRVTGYLVAGIFPVAAVVLSVVLNHVLQ